jgi:hypothetical protein
LIAASQAAALLKRAIESKGVEAPLSAETS